MEFEVHVTVHVYAEERLDDKVLIPHSKRYGILGKDFIGPLRKINGRIIKVSSDNSDYSVADLWDYLYLHTARLSGRFCAAQWPDCANSGRLVKKILCRDRLFT